MSQAPKNKPSKTDAVKAASVDQDKRLNKRLKDMPVAIVGMASIFANSRYLNKFWDLISEKIDAITDIPASHWSAEDYYNSDKSVADKSYCKRGGFMPEVDFNPMEFGLPPNILELTDTSQLLSLVIAKEVLADAGIDDTYDTDRIGITLGVGGGQKISHSLSARLQYPILKKVFANSGISDADSDMLIKKFQDQYIHWEENSFPGSLGNVISGRIANRFDFGGMNCVVDAACAGSLAAMRMALTELVEGRSDVMITGGVCTDNSPSMYMSFSKTPAFTTNETIQPFDIDSKGMMIGEGIGMVALKRLDEAERDGDRIYAVIKGVGASSDGKFKSIYAPRPEGQAKALKRAYDDAGFAPHTIGLMEAHGTGTAAGDVAEFNGLKSVFAEGNDTKQHIALGSVKSQVGHTKSTAGTAGVIKAALALHHKVLPPTINVSKPNPKLDVENSPFYLNTETRPWMARADGTPRRAGISSFGFGGTNFHLVLEEYQADHQRGDKYRQRNVAQSLLFSAETKAQLQSVLSDLQAELSTKTTFTANEEEYLLTQIAARFDVKAITATHPRLGMVVSSCKELTAQLQQVLAQLSSQNSDSWQLPSGTSYRSQAVINGEKSSSKVAALFAGQGSQYVNMGLDLACHYPEVRQQVSLADQVFSAHKQTPLSQILFPIPAFEPQDIAAQQAALTNTANAQSAIGTISMGQYQLFTQAGFSPDMVAGHSFGELSALCASGVISSEDYYQLAFARGQAMAATPKDQDAGAMYAVIIPATANSSESVAKLEQCISAFDGVKVANYNSPTQLVIAGPTESSSQAAKAISADLGFKAIALPVSGAFHTPLVAHAQQPFAKAIGKAKFSKPKVTVFANGTGKAHPSDAKAIQAAFSEHMLQSVRFSDQLQAMYDAGARVFVEFGPKNILQKLVEGTLSNQAEAVSVISINPNPKGNSDLQLRVAACQLAVLGLPLVNIDPYQAAIPAPLKTSPMNVKLSGANYISPATRKKMQTSLTTGEVSSKIVNVPVETIVERIVEKEVIKTEYIEVAAPAQSAAITQASNNQTSSNQASNSQVIQSQSMPTQKPATKPVIASGDNLGAFFAAQQQTAQLHQQFLAIPQQYGNTFAHLMNEQAKIAAAGLAIPESLQRSMEMFHQHQSHTLQSHTQFLELQAQSSQATLAMLSGQALTQGSYSAPVALPTSAPQVAAYTAPQNIAPQVVAQVAAPAPVTTQPVAPVAMRAAAPIVVPVKAPVAATVQAPASVAVPVALVQPAGLSAEKVLNTMLNVVADKTGYPTEMLELGMDMEADLGIDSIKRVEILGTVQDELPGLPELSPEDLAECRTLGEIVDYMNSKLPAAGSVVASAAPLSAVSTHSSGLSAALVQQTMMSVVADKTGYPTEMLELGMDMEADLGIDSIKRVEILGTVQDELPGLPELNPEDLAECRTLGEIVAYMNSKLPAAGSVVASAAPLSAVSTHSSGLSAALVQQTMMKVVADKTGYPTEMLELGMDMEADLGIDSIKRVEILGTVQDELPGLPELNPEDLAECRTLGEIVAYMNSKLPATSVAPSAAPANSSPVSTSSASGLSAEVVQQTMMSVVADKTGYPAEMLELSMDMEADLGIDSIKRVEILGTVQDELPGLPELNPEDLAECRTLGEIVTYMQSKLGAAASPAQTATASVQTAPATALADLPPHSEVALKKLPAADKLADCFSKDACIVITDDGHNAGVLAEKLHAKGLTVAVIRNAKLASPLSSDIRSYTLADVSDAAVSEVIADITKQMPIAGFVHLQPQSKAKANQTVALDAAAKTAVEHAFLWAKHLHAQFATLSTTGRLAYFTVSRIDGGFGYVDNSQLVAVELNQAALSGLSKTLSHEWPNVFCRALDIANNIEATPFAEAIIAELFDLNGEQVAAKRLNEVGISAQGRVTLTAQAATTQHPAAQLSKTDTVLVTGGAKGVTFECALSLAKQCKSHFVLAGRSQHMAANLPTWAQGKQASELKAAAIGYIQSQGEKPTPKQIDALVWPINSSLEIDSALAAFADVGASAQYVAMDVSNGDAVKTALTTLTDTNGKNLVITGLIHGAGVLADKHIQDKTLDELNRVYSTKVTGLASIVNHIDASKLKLVAMFSSAAGFYGNTGQSDYSMANEILNKTALKLAVQLPQAKVMSFNWGPWDGGMVSSALKKMFVERGVYVIPLQAGADLFAHSLLSNQGVQLLIGSDMQGSSDKDSAVKKPNANTELNAQGSLTLGFGQVGDTHTVTRLLEQQTISFVTDHCIAGNPVLPTVCAIQWMREVASTLTGYPVGVESYKLLKGVIFNSPASHQLRMTLTQTESGIDCLISSAEIAISTIDGSETAKASELSFKPQYQATLGINTAVIDANERDALALTSLQVNQLISLTPIRSGASLYQDASLFHGPSLQGISQLLQCDESHLTCQVTLPSHDQNTCLGFGSDARLGGYQLFAEDLLLQAMLVWARVNYDAASLPSTMGKFISVAPFKIGDTGFIKLDVVKQSARSLCANVALYHQDGRLSCMMQDAKVTISKSLNSAFVAHASGSVSAAEQESV